MDHQKANEWPAINRTITDNATACLFMMDAGGRCTFMNPAAERVTGYTFAEVEGRLLHDVIHHTRPDGTPYPLSECPIDRALPRNHPIRAHEDVFVRKDGTFFPVLCAASPIIENGMPVGTVIEVRDITEEKRSEESLRMQARVLESMTEGVSLSDANGIILYTNPAEDAMFGYEPGELIGKHVSVQNTYPPEENLRIVGEVIEALKARGVWSGEFSNVKKDGTPFTTQARITALEMSGRWHWVCVQEDITRKKQAEAERTNAIRELAGAFEALRYQSGLTRVITDNAASCLFMMDERGHPTFMNPAAEAVTGYALEEIRHRPLHYAVHHTHPDGTPFPMEECPIDRSSATLVPIRGHEDVFVRKNGTFFPVSCSVAPLEREGKTVGAVLEFRDTTEEKRAAAALEARIGQQAAVAQLGLRALSGADLPAVVDEAVALAASALGVEMCKVLQLLPGGEEVLLIAGVGWKEGLVGRGRVSAGLESQAGYTLISREPVIVEDLRTETRFSGPPLLHEHGVVSGISCIIHGHGGQPYGVLGAHTTRRRTFTRDDTDFLQAIANVVATAIERKRGEDEKAELLRRVAEAATQQRTFLRDVLRSVTEGRLRLCDSAADLPPRCPPVGEPIALSAEALRALRERARKVAQGQGFDKDRGNDLLTAVGEAGMNAVRHGGGGTGSVGADPSGMVQVWIEDQGAGIDMRRLPLATLERGFSSAGTLGHGFWLILNTIDRLYLLTGPGGTTVVMEQEHIAPAPAWFRGR